MKSTKKIIALILALTVLTCGCLMSANAVVIFGIELGQSEEDGDGLIKWLAYTNQPNSNVQCVLVPGASLVTEEGYVTVTSEVPLAFDHVFKHWEDDQGNIYYAGQSYYVDDMDTLYAVWDVKDDGESHLMHVIKTSLEALSKLLSFIFGFYQFQEEFSSQYYATATTTEPAA